MLDIVDIVIFIFFGKEIDLHSRAGGAAEEERIVIVKADFDLLVADAQDQRTEFQLCDIAFLFSSKEGSQLCHGGTLCRTVDCPQIQTGLQFCGILRL